MSKLTKEQELLTGTKDEAEENDDHIRATSRWKMTNGDKTKERERKSGPENVNYRILLIWKLSNNVISDYVSCTITFSLTMNFYGTTRRP